VSTPAVQRKAPTFSAAWGLEMKALVRLSAPIVLTNLGQMALHTTDVIMIGRLGADALAAAALGVAYISLPHVTALGILTALSALMAQELGARPNRVREVRQVLRQGYWASAIIAVPSLLFLLTAEAGLKLIGQEPELSAAAGDYLAMAAIGFVPSLLFMCFRNFIAALERPGIGVGVMVAGIFFNILANWMFIYGNLGMPALGLVGAGIATALTNIFLAVSLAVALVAIRRFRRYHVFGRFWKLDPARLKRLFAVGLPVGVTLLMEVGLFSGAAFLMGLIGRDQLAAHQIVIQVAAITFMVPMGLAQAATVRVGLAVGRGDGPGRARAGFAALTLGVVFMSAAAVFMILFRTPITGVFIDLGDPANAATAAFAASFFLYAALFQVFDAGQAIGAGALRGLADTRWPMVFAAVSYWGAGFGTAIWLGFFTPLAGAGIWIGFIAGLGLASLLMIGRFTLKTVPAIGDRYRWLRP
jgi:MATE family multidrug resistance protein